jgi:hypothetical protein
VKIKMIETQRGSVDGCRIATYVAGAEYDLSGSAGALDLAQAFIGAGFAEPVVGAAQPAAQAQESVPADGPLAECDAAAPEQPVAPSPARGRGRRKA